MSIVYSHISPLWPGGKHIGGCTGTFLWHNFLSNKFLWNLQVTEGKATLLQLFWCWWLCRCRCCFLVVMQIPWSYTGKENSSLCCRKLMLKIRRRKQASGDILHSELLMFSILPEETLWVVVRKIYVKLFVDAFVTKKESILLPFGVLVMSSTLSLKALRCCYN